MKTCRSSFDAQSLNCALKCPFDLVIAYEDPVTRDRAMLLYDRIAQRLLDDYDFQCAWWKLDHLREPSLMDQAVQDAIQANMIIMSLHGGADMPPVALDWFQAWVPNKAATKSALVALVSLPTKTGRAGNGRKACLQEVARRARMDFFLHANDPVHGTGGCSEAALVERSQAVTPCLESILHTSRAQTVHA